MFVPITLVMRCICVCGNDSNEKDEMTMCENIAGISSRRSLQSDERRNKGGTRHMIFNSKDKYKKIQVLQSAPLDS